MKKCPNCGKVYSDLVNTCSSCGTALTANGPIQQPQQYQPQQYQNQQPQQYQNQQNQPAPQPASGGYLWVLPGLFIPFAGWILYFCLRGKNPQSAKMANIGGWVGFALNALIMLSQ